MSLNLYVWYFMIGIKLGMFGNNSAIEMLAFLRMSFQGVHWCGLSYQWWSYHSSLGSADVFWVSPYVLLFFSFVVNILEEKRWDWSNPVKLCIFYFNIIIHLKFKIRDIFYNFNESLQWESKGNVLKFLIWTSMKRYVF